MCKCGCNTCETKPITMMLNESIAPRAILSEGLEYHLNNGKPLTEQLYRAGSSSYFNLWAEARALYSRGIIEVYGDDKEIITETHLGEFGILEDGTRVPLDFPMMENESLDLNEDFKIGDIIQVNPKAFPNFEFPYGTEGEISDINKADYASDDLVYTVKIKYIDGQGDESNILHVEDSNQYLTEAKNKKKDPPLNKPKRGGSKKFYVYVRDPKTKKIKKVSFGGTTGLSVKINDPKARQAFAKRHNCGKGEEKTSPKWWSCRIGRYWKQLGGDKNFSGFW